MAPRAIHQLECFESAITWARTEGFIIAPETSHAVAGVIQEAIKCREEGREKVIVFTLSWHGLMDLQGFDKYLNGDLHNYEYPAEDISRAEAELSKYPPVLVRKSGKW